MKLEEGDPIRGLPPGCDAGPGGLVNGFGHSVEREGVRTALLYHKPHLKVLEQIWNPRGCHACHLGKDPKLGKHAMGNGNWRAEVALLGVNPGQAAGYNVQGAFLAPYQAVYQHFGREPNGIMVRGSSGVFWRMMKEARVDLLQCYSTDVVKCATPKNRPVTKDEISACGDTHLRHELGQLRRLRKIVAFGKQTGEALLGRTPGFGTVSLLEDSRIEVLTVRHPAWFAQRLAEMLGTARRIREFLGATALVGGTPESGVGNADDPHVTIP